MKIRYFWTWAALNHSADTMHMMLYDDTTKLYIDAGGGMSLMQRILRREESPIEHLWMTHCHSDHLLGIAHILRIHKSWHLTIYCSRDIADRIEKLMSLIWQEKLYHRQINEWLVSYIFIDEINNIKIGDRDLQPINMYSKKNEQYGFILHYNDKKIVFLGDEAIDVLQRDDQDSLSDADRLLCEAFCTDAEQENKQPYEKWHITGKDAGHIGKELKSRNMIISHIQDYTEDKIKQRDEVKKDVESVYSGKVYVPHDNETIDLQ